MATGTESRFQDMILKAERVIVNGTDIAGTELSFVDGVTAGTGAAGKAMVLSAGEDFTWPATGILTYGGTAVTANGAELNYLDITTLGTGAASKAVVLDAGDDYTWPTSGVLTYGGTGITATGAEINYLDIASLGTGAASKAIVLSATGTYTGPTAATTKFTWSVTSDSTDAGTSVEPFVHNTTMTGIGGVGGRARFELDTNVALGGWSNALKAQAQYGSTGKTTGLGSAFVAELILSAGTVDGTYAPLEIELGVPSGASTGTNTSFIYMSVNDTPAAFDTAGYLFNIQGLTQDTNKVLKTGLTQAVTAAASIRVKIGATDYFIPLCAVQALTS